MRGNLSGYQDHLVVKAMNATQSEIAVGTPIAVTGVTNILDGSKLATVAVSVTEWMPLVQSTIGQLDTLHIGFCFRAIPAYTVLDADEDIKTHEGLGEVLICGEGFVTLGNDGVLIGDELYLATAAPGGGGGAANVTAVTQTTADGLRQVAIAQEDGDTGDTIRAFVYPFPRDYVAPL